MNFNKLDTITLDKTLPVVFVGSENEHPVVSSNVWMKSVEFRRSANYMVEAESGTGKSSMCAYIYGTRRDYKGKIFFNGNIDTSTLSISDWCKIRRCHIAYLPQEMKLFSELTAMENIMIKNRLTDRYGEHEIKQMLDALEISHKADVVAGRLSVGQQQRIAIIRALCQPFDFILLDEPVSHLDRRNNITVAKLISDVARDNQASVITTSVGNPLLLKELEQDIEIKSVKL